MDKCLTGVISLLVILIVITGICIQQTFYSVDKANVVERKYDMHQSKQTADYDWIIKKLDEISQDVKQIKNDMQKKRVF